MDEFAAIARFFAPLAAGEPGALGLADDAAVLEVPAGRRLVVTKDVMAAGVHFLADDPAEDVGRKLLRVNLSDLAAMGAVPWVYLLGLTLSRPVDTAWLEAFARGLATDQAEFGVVLVGGDTTAHDGPTVLTLTALGTVAPGAALLRSGARPGDAIWVSGTLGDAAFGLAVLRGEHAGLSPVERDYLAGRYRLPMPRLALGQGLVGLASAALDISDGLLADLGHIGAASGLGATVEVASLPLSEAVRRLDGDWLPRAISWGDDYELLFTAPADAESRILALGQRLGLRLTRIGVMRAGTGVSLVDADGRVVAPPGRTGWTHF